MRKVLDVYDDDTGYVPQPSEDDPPSEEVDRQRLTRGESMAQWRVKVGKCLRIKDQLYPHEIPWRRRYMTFGESRMFWRWRNDGVRSQEGYRAVRKVFYLMERAGVLLA